MRKQNYDVAAVMNGNNNDEGILSFRPTMSALCYGIAAVMSGNNNNEGLLSFTPTMSASWYWVLLLLGMATAAMNDYCLSGQQ
eukprot:6092108-Ditylum_brightwellii.AAC.1